MEPIEIAMLGVVLVITSPFWIPAVITLIISGDPSSRIVMEFKNNTFPCPVYVLHKYVRPCNFEGMYVEILAWEWICIFGLILLASIIIGCMYGIYCLLSYADRRRNGYTAI